MRFVLLALSLSPWASAGWPVPVGSILSDCSTKILYEQGAATSGNSVFDKIFRGQTYQKAKTAHERALLVEAGLDLGGSPYYTDSLGYSLLLRVVFDSQALVAPQSDEYAYFTSTLRWWGRPPIVYGSVDAVSRLVEKHGLDINYVHSIRGSVLSQALSVVPSSLEFQMGLAGPLPSLNPNVAFADLQTARWLVAHPLFDLPVEHLEEILNRYGKNGPVSPVALPLDLRAAIEAHLQKRRAKDAAQALAPSE